MLRWFRELFCGKSESAPVKVEVTLNVPAIHVFVHGPETGEVSETSESRSVLPSREKRITTDNTAAFAEDDQINRLTSKLGRIETPKVPFGEEKPPASPAV